MTSINSKHIVLTVTILTGVFGCRFRTVDSPVGVEKSTDLPFLSISSVNTHDRYKEECLPWLADAQQGRTAMLKKDVYQACFANHMLAVEPGKGQKSAPVPVDLDGDGNPDFVRYAEGYQVPYTWYSMYPGMYWPGVYQSAGIAPMSFGNAGYMGMIPNGTMPVAHATPPSQMDYLSPMYANTTMPVVMATGTPATQAATKPSNPDEQPATKKDVRALRRQLGRTTDAVEDLQEQVAPRK
ncbi:MAG: hypothetical protein WC477_04035 [Patescibacteria group bacterium]